MLDRERMLSLVSNRFLELILLPTEQCNFRCTYCYEDFSIGKMQRKIINAVRQLISNRIDSLDILKISWFGGEPLAAKDIVCEISEHIIELRQHYPGLRYISGMTTNGMLLKKEVLSKMVECGVTDFQISLDGTETLHNKTRIRMNGSGTFKMIWDNLLAAKNTNLDFTINLRIHITPDNINDIYKLIDQIKASFGDDKRFSIFFKAIENLGGPNAGTFKVMHGREKGQIIEDLYQYLGNQISSRKLEANGPYVCYAAQTNSFLIRADGRIGKCTVAFNDDRNTIGKLNCDGTIEIDKDKLYLWTRGLGSQNLGDLKCPMSRMPTLHSRLQSIPVVVQA